MMFAQSFLFFWVGKIPKKGKGLENRTAIRAVGSTIRKRVEVQVQVSSLLSRPPQSLWYLGWKWELDPCYSTCMYCAEEPTTLETIAWPRYQAGKWLKGCQKMQMLNYSSARCVYPWTSSFMHLISSNAHFMKGRKNQWHKWGKVLIRLFRHSLQRSSGCIN